ncbi:MAG: hypothetical protein ABIJ75_07125 [Actinomycetota bacterium]
MSDQKPFDHEADYEGEPAGIPDSEEPEVRVTNEAPTRAADTGPEIGELKQPGMTIGERLAAIEESRLVARAALARIAEHAEQIVVVAEVQRRGV